jgi:hypothetical protein
VDGLRTVGQPPSIPLKAGISFSLAVSIARFCFRALAPVHTAEIHRWLLWWNRVQDWR